MQDKENSLMKYSDEELVRLIRQFSHTEKVEQELYRRYCEGILSAVTLPVRLLDAWRERGVL